MFEPRRVAYADTSALAKLVLDEPEAAHFADAFSSQDRVLTSILGAVELERAARRARGEDGGRQVAMILDRLTLVRVSDEVRRVAARIAPSRLRTLDAIHLASAMEPGRAGPFYCYDRRLCDAALAAGLPVESPGT